MREGRGGGGGGGGGGKRREGGNYKRISVRGAITVSEIMPAYAIKLRNNVRIARYTSKVNMCHSYFMEHSV